MIVEFRDGDRMLGMKAVGIYRKAIEAAVAACDKVYVPTMELQTADTDAEAACNWLADRLDEMGVGEARELTIPADLAVALRTASSCYLTQLGKLSEKQVDLLVPLEDTNELMSKLTSLSDRLSGQTELAGVATTMTMKFGDIETGPITMDDLQAATKSVERNNRKRRTPAE